VWKESLPAEYLVQRDLRNCSPELKIEYVGIDPTQQHE